MIQTFLDGSVVLHPGDCRDVLARLPDASVDSIVTDPPYALVSIVKRFGGANAAPVKVNEFYAEGGDSKGSSPYLRASAGFMGKTWDTGEAAFAVEFWAQCLRVLKPGGHVAAFGGTRTYHRLACAIEDAGFEIRDTLMWLYGAGFPKSHDVSKGIDKRGGETTSWVGAWIKDWRKQRKLSQRELCERCGFYGETNRGGTVANWELGLGAPTVEQFNTLCAVLDLPFKTMQEAERDVIAKGHRIRRASVVQCVGISEGEFDITAPSTDAAKQWQGWGTALKPAVEPIVLARKPLIGTVAANVLQHGTGALNIDGCRIGTESTRRPTGTAMFGKNAGWNDHNLENMVGGSDSGRWPANLLHDGSPEVVEGFPSEAGAAAPVHKRGGDKFRNTYGSFSGNIDEAGSTFQGDTGSAARFFYTSKADASDRLGSKHPTVKPIDLMQWLVRLITPKGGVVLDPFSGTGTTGEAAWREGMKAILVEREPEYQVDIARRMELATQPTKRAAVAATKNNLDDPNDLPLFAAE